MLKKKIPIVFLIFVLVFAVLTSSCSNAQGTTVIILQVDNTVMTVNGVKADIDCAPIIKNNRTLVPVRAVTEALGGTVMWNNAAKEATLTRGTDTIVLVVDSTTAYLNGTENILDTAPSIYGGRTMLPIRFVAESFGLHVSWDSGSKTITITDSFSAENIPPFSNVPYVTVNGNRPYFTDSEITSVSFEYYTNLDYLGRCGACIASVGRDIMPTEPRGAIGQIKPSGWQTVKYDSVDGKYLYNRCHLLGYQLTGENSNEKNLITGTRYLNVSGMLPFENKVSDYVKETGNHVMYRATPIFEGTNLLASGVLLEGLSVEDRGKGIRFCVYCYNAQPGISINYANGDSTLKIEKTRERSEASYILNNKTKKFHYPSCSSAKQISDKNRALSNKAREELIGEGYSPCGECKP